MSQQQQQQQQQLSAVLSQIGHSSAPTNGLVEPDVTSLLEVDGNGHCCHNKVSADVKEEDTINSEDKGISADVVEKEQMKKVLF